MPGGAVSVLLGVPVPDPVPSRTLLAGESVHAVALDVQRSAVATVDTPGFLAQSRTRCAVLVLIASELSSCFSK